MRFRQAAAVRYMCCVSVSMALRCFVLSTAHSLDVLRQHPRHLEHAHRGGGQDLLQLRVRRDGAALAELVLLDVDPEGLHDLRAGHLVLAADRGEVGGQRLGGEEPNALLLLRRRDLLTGRRSRRGRRTASWWRRAQCPSSSAPPRSSYRPPSTPCSCGRPSAACRPGTW